MNAQGPQSLLSAAAVRERAHELLDIALQGDVAEWRVDLGRLDAVADLTAEVVRTNYPDLKTPFHARWRHFQLGGRDLWAERADSAAWAGPLERAEAEFDLAVVSVLLDAGAGPTWGYHDRATGAALRRSEGLAIASLRLFESGRLSSDPARPLQADALARVTSADLADAFQAGPDNPLLGLEGRIELLHRLADAVGRPGRLVEDMLAYREGASLAAPAILEVLLARLGPIWPGRLVLDGVPLGDCWAHPAIRRR